MQPMEQTINLTQLYWLLAVLGTVVIGIAAWIYMFAARQANINERDRQARKEARKPDEPS